MSSTRIVALGIRSSADHGAGGLRGPVGAQQFVDLTPVIDPEVAFGMAVWTSNRIPMHISRAFSRPSRWTLLWV